MSKKIFLGLVILMVVFVVASKITWLMTQSSPPAAATNNEMMEPELKKNYDLIQSEIPEGPQESEIVKRALAIQEMALYHDKDKAIVALEKLEEKQRIPFLADRLRRAVVALRFNKPVDQLTEDELTKLLLESNRSM